MECMLVDALGFAFQSHKGQVRKYTNEDYIIHPVRVAARVLLAAPDVSDDVVAAAYLHDVVEDCNVPLDSMYQFGTIVATLVGELTNPSKNYPDLPRKDRKQMDLEHIANASLEAKMIKLADRCDNILDMPLGNPEARRFLGKTYLRETLSLYEVIKDGHEILAKELLEAINFVKNELELGGCNGSCSCRSARKGSCQE